MKNPNPEEVWRDVPGYDGRYMVSSLGRVYSNVRCRLMSPGMIGPPHGKRLAVFLTLPGERRGNVTIHRIVADAFLPKPDGDVEVCHNNGDPLDNRAVNLRWDTRSANANDRVAHGTDANARRTHCGRGHRLGHPNTYPSLEAKGQRSCKACIRASRFLVKHPGGDRQKISDQFYLEITAEERRTR